MTVTELEHVISIKKEDDYSLSLPLNSLKHIRKDHIVKGNEPWERILDSVHRYAEGAKGLAHLGEVIVSQINTSSQRPMVMFQSEYDIDKGPKSMKDKLVFVCRSGVVVFVEFISGTDRALKLLSAYFPQMNPHLNRSRWERASENLVIAYSDCDGGRQSFPALTSWKLHEDRKHGRVYMRGKTRFQSSHKWGFDNTVTPPVYTYGFPAWAPTPKSRSEPGKRVNLRKRGGSLSKQEESA